jgi:hypothetical protein
MCLVTAWLEKNHVGAQGTDFAMSFPERCLIAGHVFWFYIGKLLWPAQLCFVYPRWHLDIGSWWLWLYPATAVGMLLELWLVRSRIGWPRHCSVMPGKMRWQQWNKRFMASVTSWTGR